jgi:hypothetical protein
MKRTATFLTLMLALFACLPLAAQTEPESSAEPGVFQSNLGKRDQELSIGSTIKYQKTLRHRPSPPLEFKGLVDTFLIAGPDTIPISSIGYLQAKSDLTLKKGRILLIAGLAMIPVGILAGIFGLVAALAYLFPLSVALFLIAYLCTLAFLPLIIAGVILLASGRKWFDLRREWKLVKQGPKTE